MSRPRRLNHGRQPLHVIARCVAGDVLFPDHQSWEHFWDEFGTRAVENDVVVGHVCLMTTHYHLLVRADREALADTLHRAHGKLAWYRNREGMRRGRVFGRRYDVIPIISAKHLLEVSRYIPRNPVKAGMVSNPSSWRWSTHRYLAGKQSPPEWYDIDAALRMVAFFDSRSYERWVLADTPLAIPPMTQRELLDHRIWTMSESGKSDAEIAEAFRLTLRTARSRISAGALRSRLQ